MQQNVFNVKAQSESIDDWHQLQSGNREQQIQAWLNIQCSTMESVVDALVLGDFAAAKPPRPMAAWPGSHVALEPLIPIIEEASTKRKPLLSKVASGEYALVLPVCNNNDELFALVAARVRAAHDAELKQVMRYLQWGVSWLDALQLRTANKNLQGMAQGVNLLASVLGKKHYNEAVMALVNELCRAMPCDLACLGRRKADTMRATQFSNATQFGKKMNIVRGFEDAMEEAADQRAVICLPGDNKNLVTRAHRDLAKSLDQSSHFLTLPLYLSGEPCGAVCLQRVSGEPFAADEILRCESILAFASPVLEDKRLAGRHLLQKLKDDSVEQVQRFVGKQYWGRKLVALAAIAVLALLINVKGSYRLSSNAVVATAMQQAVVAPIDGYLIEAPKRAGDSVVAGELLARLDDREQQLEKLRWLGQYKQLQSQYHEAIAQHERASTTIIAAQMEQAKANIDLMESQIQRLQQRAPFSGLIVSGDLSQHLGSAVKQGDPLFEVAPTEKMRLFLRVKQSRIAHVKLGQQGWLYLSALPQQPYAITVNKITPVTESIDNASFFRVEATIDGSHQKLQPGMEGIGKLVIDRRRLLDIWTMGLRDWLRLHWWRILG